MIGRGFKSSEDIGSYLLSRAGAAVVPFQLFDLTDDNGWMSIGDLSLAERSGALEPLEVALCRRC